MNPNELAGRTTISKKDILTAATELFLSDGYEHVSMRKIALKISCSSTNLYNHFKNKEEILLFMLKDGYAIFLQYLQQARTTPHKNEDILNQIRTVMRAYLQFGLDHPSYYRIMFIHNMENLHLTISGETDMIKGYMLIVDLMNEAIHSNVIASIDAHLTSQSLWAALHGIISLFITFPGFYWTDREALIDFHIENCLKGLQR